MANYYNKPVENSINKELVKDSKIGILVSEWNQEITDSLCKAAQQTLIKYGVAKENILHHYIPGSYELPSAAKIMINSTDVDAVICIGCIIEGETRHFEFIANAVAIGINKVALKTNKPVIFGVLTTQNMIQAKERAGGNCGNKGEEAALAALKMLQFKKELILNK